MNKAQTSKIRWTLLVPLILLAGLLSIPALRYAHLVACEDRIRHYAYDLQYAIERTTLDNIDGLHPEGGAVFDVETLLRSGYLKAHPINPFTKQPVRIIDWGSSASPGDIRLLHAEKYYVYSGKREVSANTGYILIAYGIRLIHRSFNNYSLDFDGDGYSDPIVVILEPGSSHGTGYGEAPAPIEETLSKYGYGLPLDAALPNNESPVWRYIFGF